MKAETTTADKLIRLLNKSRQQRAGRTARSSYARIDACRAQPTDPHTPLFAVPTSLRPVRRRPTDTATPPDRRRAGNDQQGLVRFQHTSFCAFSLVSFPAERGIRSCGLRISRRCGSSE